MDEQTNKELKSLLLGVTKKVLLTQEALASPVTNWIKDPRINEDPAVVVAAASGSRSNWWTKGRIHRDHQGKSTDVIMMELYLDDISEDDGGVLFWKDSLRFREPQNRRDKGRSISEHATSESVIALGKKGTLFAWNGLTMHQSMPNVTGRPMAMPTRGSTKLKIKTLNPADLQQQKSTSVPTNNYRLVWIVSNSGLILERFK